MTSIFKLALFLILALILPSGELMAGEKAPNKESPSKAQRVEMGAAHRKMAELHNKMAECLESDKDPNDCRLEMTQACSDRFGGNCPMTWRGMMRGTGMMGMMGGGYCVDWTKKPDNEDKAPKSQPK